MSSEKIMKLNLTNTNIDMLHTSIGRLSRLKKLKLTNSRLQSLPNEFCFLTSLRSLCLARCKQVTELPHNIKSLSRLIALDLHDCWGLQSLPELPPSIVGLNATNCISLHTVFGISLQTSFNMKALFYSAWTVLLFKNCKKLAEHSLYHIMEDAHDALVQRALCDLLVCGTGIYKGKGIKDFNNKVWYPGSKVPEWFRYQTRQASITVELDQPSQILGFFLCCVISQTTTPDQVILPQYYLGDGEKDKCKQKLKTISVYRQLNSDHVCIWYDHHKQILDGIANSRVDDHCTTYNQKISLEFIGKSHKRYKYEDKKDEGFYTCNNFGDEYGDWDDKDEEEVKFGDWLVKGCGICPIYISDIQNFIQKVDMELEFNDDKFKEYRELVLDKFHSKNLEVVGEGENASLKARKLIIDPVAIAISWKRDDARVKTHSSSFSAS